MSDVQHVGPTIMASDGRRIPVRRVEHGEIITEPGIYDMPNAWYHADCCDGPSISSTGLRTIYAQSPAHYWFKSALNPERDPEDDEEETEALRIGRAAHLLLLEPALFHAQVIARPPMFDSWRTNAAKAWRAEKQLEGFTVLNPDEMQRIAGIANALRAHPLFAEGILDGDIERSLIWKDQKTGVWLKARPDAIPRGSNVFGDLKCVKDASDRALHRMVFWDRQYDMQMALGGIGMRILTGRRVEEHVLVAVESKKPHAIAVRPIHEAAILEAEACLRFAVDRFARCWEEKRWPSYEDSDSLYLHRPARDSERLADLQKIGQFPKQF